MLGILFMPLSQNLKSLHHYKQSTAISTKECNLEKTERPFRSKCWSKKTKKSWGEKKLLALEIYCIETFLLNLFTFLVQHQGKQNPPSPYCTFAVCLVPITHPSSLHLLRGHDDDVRILLIHHLPEVNDRILQAALGGNENFALLHVAALFMITLHSIDNYTLSEVFGFGTETIDSYFAQTM